jgi:glycosyltransferase involved in cell wall biosynthesis
MSRCLFVFLPLTFATANNALLEGLSLGVPVVCSDVPGVKDYLSDKKYLVSDVQAVVDFFLRQRSFSAEERLSEAKGLQEYCRTNFGWPEIRDRVTAAAEAVCS